jgi:AAA15 family ATPase/GTPase
MRLFYKIKLLLYKPSVTMLIQFSVKNYTAFKEKATLSLVASNYDKDTREADNVIHIPGLDLRILKSAVIYGANASGKSKFMQALLFMKEFVKDSSKESQKGDSIDVDPFRLNDETELQPSEFEVMFLIDNEIYRYGFEATRQRILAEWLYHRPKTKEVELFYRQEQGFEIHERNFSKGNTLVKEKMVRPNALMLSVAAQFNDKHAGKVLDWFEKIQSLSGLNNHDEGFSIYKTADPRDKKRILDLLKMADLGIRDVNVVHADVDNLPGNIPKIVRDKMIKEIKDEKADIILDVMTSHRKYDKNNHYIGDTSFSLDGEESSGTRKFFALTAPIITVLDHGMLLIADELDAKLHPNLVCSLIALFNSGVSNKNNAQLVFNTHDTNLLDSGLFRRDQVWFSKKDRYGAASIYSLTEFKSSVRKNEDFESNYISGKYGGVPSLQNFQALYDTEDTE